MDRTLLLLSIVSGVLLVILAPHTTLTLTAAIALAVVTIRGIWSFVQSFDPIQSRRAID
ncbi:MAG: hypothetical protein AAGD09_06770 [Cyanobacteria bacterium P01_F01_bin.56]